jgi:hypothetical protein
MVKTSCNHRSLSFLGLLGQRASLYIPGKVKNRQLRDQKGKYMRQG